MKSEGGVNTATRHRGTREVNNAEEKKIVRRFTNTNTNTMTFSLTLYTKPFLTGKYNTLFTRVDKYVIKFFDRGVDTTTSFGMTG